MLGRKGKDKITGFSGTITGRVEYLTGCNQFLIVPGTPKPDGTLIDPVWFDEQRIELTAEPAIVLDNSKTPGPDAPPPRKH